MGSIIVALPKAEDARKISDLLNRRGYKATSICTTASAVLAKANELDRGIVICGKRLPDMYYVQLAEYLPDFFDMLLLTSTPAEERLSDGIVPVKMPLKLAELLGTVEMMMTQLDRRYKKAKSKPKLRSPEEQKVIDEAKALLIERNDMTEQEAFRYIQKNSMDSGTSMVETAQMILMMDFS